MLHRCSQCYCYYTTSRYGSICDYCGCEQAEHLELQWDDGVVEWWELAIEAEFGVEVEQTRRWWIG